MSVPKNENNILIQKHCIHYLSANNSLSIDDYISKLFKNKTFHKIPYLENCNELEETAETIDGINSLYFSRLNNNFIFNMEELPLYQPTHENQLHLFLLFLKIINTIIQLEYTSSSNIFIICKNTQVLTANQYNLLYSVFQTPIISLHHKQPFIHYHLFTNSISQMPNNIINKCSIIIENNSISKINSKNNNGNDLSINNTAIDNLYDEMNNYLMMKHEIQPIKDTHFNDLIFQIITYSTDFKHISLYIIRKCIINGYNILTKNNQLLELVTNQTSNNEISTLLLKIKELIYTIIYSIRN